MSYSRGVYGLGTRPRRACAWSWWTLAFRPIGSFNPSEITPEKFKEARAQERMNLLLQNLGRALRGEPGKTVVLIVVNANDNLKEALMESRALREACDLPPVFAAGQDLPALIDQAGRWLAAGGGEWPAADPAKAKPAPERDRRPLVALVESAKAAAEAGKTWREFSRQANLNRRTKEEQRIVKEAFYVV